MVILGLTGSIGMGKSAAARMLARLGVPVHDADAAVHRLLGRGGAAVAPIGRAFPGVIGDGAVDRAALGKVVFGDPAALRRLEAIVHPLVRQAERRFLGRAARQRRRLVALDIPLLFETGGDARCDAVLVVSAPAALQAQRVLRRPGMTRQRLAAVRTQQMADATKRALADVVAPTGLGYRKTLRSITLVVKMLWSRPGSHWPPRQGAACARSYWTRRRRASTRWPGIVSSKSAASS